jgi:hypothetical protein
MGIAEVSPWGSSRAATILGKASARGSPGTSDSRWAVPRCAATRRA